MSTKAQLRQKFRAVRDAIPAGERQRGSQAIHQTILNLPELGTAQSVFVYASAGSEVATHELIEALLVRGKTVAVPHITDPKAGRMQAVVIHALQDLVPDPHLPSLLTPQTGEPLGLAPDLTLLPGLAFSPETGVRLGMGGGYYDRFFDGPGHEGGLRVGLAFDEQLRDDLPVETHDYPVHAIATPRRLYRISAED
ncbi:5-formyltetrahydrofolate cyclo-ligase [Algisphaera agarilytica]|uniref:5-formyltetrahydrofolate cyclo-ligase n=1 Tax=Algisphaera agarilytica TaxID=1385975 RepID=A0A7X0LM62_9BACT|nr:5-formyltetrahydrofolate cyclo-ligase [Algisphaera agarilytica]MBB6431732.1 5-formyltetrahydrofolate cyclo-ligase [Algisphaera agarilytica]